MSSIRQCINYSLADWTSRWRDSSRQMILSINARWAIFTSGCTNSHSIVTPSIPKASPESCESFVWPIVGLSENCMAARRWDPCRPGWGIAGCRRPGSQVARDTTAACPPISTWPCIPPRHESLHKRHIFTAVTTPPYRSSHRWPPCISCRN